MLSEGRTNACSPAAADPLAFESGVRATPLHAVWPVNGMRGYLHSNRPTIGGLEASSSVRTVSQSFVPFA